MPKHQITCGSQHHLIMECQFHLSTFIDGILISTVGEYIRKLPVEEGDPRETVGLDRFYETYVFNTDDDWTEKKTELYEAYRHPDVIDWSEIDARPAQTVVEATTNHWVVVDEHGGTQ